MAGQQDKKDIYNEKYHILYIYIYGTFLVLMSCQHNNKYEN